MSGRVQTAEEASGGTALLCKLYVTALPAWQDKFREKIDGNIKIYCNFVSFSDRKNVIINI